MTALRFTLFDGSQMHAMADLWVESWQRAYPEIDFEARRVWLIERLTAFHAQGVLICLATHTATAQLAGFVTLDPATGHINQLVVGLAHWGRGVGGALIQWCKDHGSSRLNLEVNADNHTAIALYQRHGFVQVGEGINPNSGRPVIQMVCGVEQAGLNR
ncbi:MAG TPA: GNAT family N-acetyltransferase [Alphaproteobacteria bacterium]|nr:GNAT family N-acetyltransferase [Alphaproteobacteria bacterium]HAJ47903.1 GNAT family N-acetyltransferase [Alphaproteobacteria bacterium]